MFTGLNEPPCSNNGQDCTATLTRDAPTSWQPEHVTNRLLSAEDTQRLASDSDVYDNVHVNLPGISNHSGLLELNTGEELPETISSLQTETSTATELGLPSRLNPTAITPAIPPGSCPLFALSRTLKSCTFSLLQENHTDLRNAWQQQPVILSSIPDITNITGLAELCFISPALDDG
jgi:hypothetical protein